MAILEYFSIFENIDVKICDNKTYIIEKEKINMPALELESVPITLAEQNSLTKGKLTAHRIRDYRKSVFNLILLPDIEILFDKLIYGGENEPL